MKVKISSPGEYDRHDKVVRFDAAVDRAPISVVIDDLALLTIAKALGNAATEPLTIYAIGGRLLEAVVADVVRTATQPQATYYVSYADVLRVTGMSGDGDRYVPKHWTG
ncbi:hypothetical protein [Sphingomonas sp. SUN039]|uniref:hypothetical protein n=1 Tax=Sphingomonas sp. SUN039 TaxID=2937787 RepID=UPI0021640F0B|nr:hypothetical protein [Sphingomonas sp. SUN039]UVO54748.1 hypothetical protein M0209_11680 [Sphingomonas sp. SUN039]